MENNIRNITSYGLYRGSNGSFSAALTEYEGISDNQNNSSATTLAYIDGNTVVWTFPEIEDGVLPYPAPLNAPDPSTKEGGRILKNRQKSLSMRPANIVFLFGAILCALTVCIHYVQLQSSVTKRLNHIATLQVEYETLKTNNRAIKKEIEPYTDYAYIYEFATKKLGMEPASADQIVTYERQESEYVKQYENIPEN